MSENAASFDLVPAGTVQPPAPVGLGWGGEPTLAPPKSPLERPLAAIRRYKWLLLAVVLLATLGGVIATRMVKPEYEVRATISIQSETPLQDKEGPIRPHELLNAEAWVELLKTFRISDAVVKQLALFVKPENDADSALFRGFDVANRMVPGKYELEVPGNGSQWRLALADGGYTESGAAGDSIGRKLGFAWQPTPALLSRYAGKKVEFTVATPRETSVELQKRLHPNLPEKSNFLWITFTDPNPELAEHTLNAWVEEYVKVAGELKRKNLVEFSNILSGQLDYAAAALKDAESSLEGFKVHTITLPTENTAIAAGVQLTQDPALKNFFDKKIEYDNLRADREALQKVLTNAAAGTVQYEAALLIPSVANNPGAQELRNSFDKLYKLQADLATARQLYKDEYQVNRDLIGQINTLKTRTIPQQANALLSQLELRERDYQGRIAGQSRDLQSIPTRTIEEARLTRNVDVAAQLYTTLKNRYAEAKLAEASALPDVSILDSAVAPLKPTKNTAPRIMAIAVLGGLAAAIALALLLDNVDRKIRYPDQAAGDLGLSIAATVPRLPKGGINSQNPEQVSQLVESFRTLRMNVVNATGPTQIALAVSSPQPGDGKSFISSNLAMSFADAGFSTLLVDGDTRRGTLHEMFGLPKTAGLTDFLAGDASESAIIHQTGHEKLSVIPSGNPRRRSPELLTSPVLTRLVADLRTKYDVVIFDTPPLAAGIDGYAIAAATGSLLVVLRIGQTEKRMAAAKLLLVDRLPINVLGSVLNAAPTYGEYEYYGYVSGYGTEGLEPGKEVVTVS
jgi:capsular exopolysaccharide synthesis family protein